MGQLSLKLSSLGLPHAHSVSSFCSQFSCIVRICIIIMIIIIIIMIIIMHLYIYTYTCLSMPSLMCGATGALLVPGGPDLITTCVAAGVFLWCTMRSGWCLCLFSVAPVCGLRGVSYFYTPRVLSEVTLLQVAWDAESSAFGMMSTWARCAFPTPFRRWHLRNHRPVPKAGSWQLR